MHSRALRYPLTHPEASFVSSHVVILFQRFVHMPSVRYYCYYARKNNGGVFDRIYYAALLCYWHPSSLSTSSRLAPRQLTFTIRDVPIPTLTEHIGLVSVVGLLPIMG